MANTYSQLLIHLVFAVKHRQALISSSNRVLVEKYIAGIIKQRNHKLLAQYCMPNHIHILIDLNPKDSLSALVREVKSSSSKWINNEKFIKQRFEWQNGYGAFSHSASSLQTVIDYIINQPTHHKKSNFKNEYRSFLEKNNIEFNARYIFKEPS